jgi:hypothetical protein
MPDLLEPPRKSAPPWLAAHLFTKETATLARARRTEYERKLSAMPTPQALARNATLDDFNAMRLVRVREQLTKLDAMIEAEEDAQKLDRLASASAKLSEQERVLDGRPLPGSRRPPTDKAQRAGTWGELQPALPQVAPVAQMFAPTERLPSKPMGWEYDEPKATIPEPTPQPVVFAPVLS